MDARRRWLVTHLPLAVLAAPLGAEAQGPPKTEAQKSARIPAVGIILTGTEPTLADVFRQALREQGHVDGTTIAVDVRSLEGDADRIPPALAELIRRPVDVLVVMNNDITVWAKAVAKTIPIVIVDAHDAVGAGFVASLTRPGGNITGGESFSPELDARRVEMLKQIVPALSRLALVYNPSDPGMASHLRHTEAAASKLGMKVRRVEARTAAQLDAGLASLAQDRPDALLPFGDTLVGGRMRAVIEHAASQRVAALYDSAVFAQMGGLIAHGPNAPALVTQAAVFVAQILKGASPAVLAMKQASKFDLVVNMKTARALGLTIPPALLGRADRVIE
jgi:putative ABC transport system substrate-binding protein